LQPFAIGMVLFCNIMMFGSMSGGHFNPAVTLSVLVRSGPNIPYNLPIALLMIGSQLAGASLGVLIVRFTIQEGTSGETKGFILGDNYAILCPADPTTMIDGANTEIQKCNSQMAGAALIMEIVCTFVFTSVINNVIHLNGSEESAPTAFTVGATLTGMIITSAKTSGGCINTAVGIV